jgi:hypothetical protein
MRSNDARSYSRDVSIASLWHPACRCRIEYDLTEHRAHHERYAVEDRPGVIKWVGRLLDGWLPVRQRRPPDRCWPSLSRTPARPAWNASSQSAPTGPTRLATADCG